MTSVVLLLLLLDVARAQHYCWPCAKRYGVIGKSTHAASDAPGCYEWYLRYLNNVVEGASNTGKGWLEFEIPGFGTAREAFDVPPNVLALETNEGGTLIGNYTQNTTLPPSAAQQKLIDQGLRLPTGAVHQCPCALAGRAHTLNASTDDLLDFSTVEDEWGGAYVERVKAVLNHTTAAARSAMSPVEARHFSPVNIFGLHAISCPFHSSGPCTLSDVEAGVSRAWAHNFSAGYSALLDSNTMFWARSLGPLIDAFLRDRVSFYPMVWSSGGKDVYSVLASPCGKTLVEVAAPYPGRPAFHFHRMPHARAHFVHWNAPDVRTQPLVPLRISRAVGPELLEQVLAFYGVGRSGADLGFHTTVLADETIGGDRAVTLMLSADAKTHLQLWARKEPQPSDSSPPFPSPADFRDAVGRNQINGGQPAAAQPFCSAGEWTVSRYTSYIRAVHASVMTPPPLPSYDLLRPPAGVPMDVFLDDHIAWDCTAPECDLATGGRALYAHNSSVQWVPVGEASGWAAYSHDPAGYGVELHWFAAPTQFAPVGTVYPGCFDAWPSNDTCPGAFLRGAS